MPNKEDRYSYPPRGMSRETAARYIGVGTTTFDKLVAEGRMPKPKRVGGRVIWDRWAIEGYFEDLDEAAAKTNFFDAFLQASRNSTAVEDLGPSDGARAIARKQRRDEADAIRRAQVKATKKNDGNTA